jgi:hypothetical protein
MCDRPLCKCPQDETCYIVIDINISIKHKMNFPKIGLNQFFFFQNIYRMYNQNCKNLGATHSQLCHVNCKINFKKWI